MDEQVEHLRFHVCAPTLSMQLTPIAMDFAVFE
jgi:hypothetical protein